MLSQCKEVAGNSLKTVELQSVVVLPERVPASPDRTAVATSPVETKLDLASKLYQESIYPSAVKVARGERLRAPLVVDLDPTSFCDLACPECISTGVLNQGQFPRRRLEQIAEEMAAAGVQAVILIGGGEPLMHKGVGRVIEILHSAGIRIGLVTNGTLIDRHLDDLAARLSWIRVSVDAATAETYGQFRPSRSGASQFPKIIANMRRLARCKQGKLGYSFLLMQRRDDSGKVIGSNYHEVLQAGLLARSIGCDYFEIKAMMNDDHVVAEQTEADVALVSRQLETLRTLESEHFRLLESSTWRELSRTAPEAQVKNYRACKIAELRTTITPSGVYICAYHRGDPGARLGDVLDTPLTQMWSEAKVEAVNPATDCQFHCARHDSNVELERIGISPGGRAVQADYDPFL
jgi:MoaA/NifB/PqqE/SkfB family radical SAM enzyme